MVHLPLCLTNYAIRYEGLLGVNVQIHVFLTWVVFGVNSFSFSPRERAHNSDWTGGCVGSRASLDGMEKILDPTSTQILTSQLSRQQPVTIPTAPSRLLKVALDRVYIYIQHRHSVTPFNVRLKVFPYLTLNVNDPKSINLALNFFNL